MASVTTTQGNEGCTDAEQAEDYDRGGIQVRMQPGPDHIAEQKTHTVIRKDIMAKRGMWDDMCREN